MEHVLETATAGDEPRRDANELRLCRRKFFHSTGERLDGNDWTWSFPMLYTFLEFIDGTIFVPLSLLDYLEILYRNIEC